MNDFLRLIDDQYEYIGITHDRVIARAVVLNQRNEIALILLSRDDEFGKYEYYETPGGGVFLNENIDDAVIREIKEELGCECEIIKKLGIVDDYYNLIKRHNINHYYLLKVINYCEKNLEEYETIMFKSIIWNHVDNIINLYKNMPNEKVSLLVKRRELPIMLKVKKYLEEEK